MPSSGADTCHLAGSMQGWTPLHSAVSSGREKVVATLLELGVEVDATNSGGQTPLHYAVRVLLVFDGSWSGQQVSVAGGANKACAAGLAARAATVAGCVAAAVAEPVLRLPLLRLPQASKGYVNILRQLLRAGAKVNAKDKTGSTPLHRAASAGKFDAALVLLEEGHARVDSHDKTASTALLVAVSCKEANIAILLASKGANLEVRRGRTHSSCRTRGCRGSGGRGCSSSHACQQQLLASPVGAPSATTCHSWRVTCTYEVPSVADWMLFPALLPLLLLATGCQQGGRDTPIPGR